MILGSGLSENSSGLLFLTDEQLRKGIEAMFFATEVLLLIQIVSCPKGPMAEPIIGPYIL